MMVYSLLFYIALAMVASAIPWALTTLRYHDAMKPTRSTGKDSPPLSEPATIPHSIPWLGHALQFLLSPPGQYWQNLFSWHPRSSGICTLLIAGRKTHIVYSRTAAQVLLRHK